MLLESFKKILSGLGYGSHILVMIFIYQDYALEKLRKKEAEIGSSENLVTPQCCTIEQSPERN